MKKVNRFTALVLSAVMTMSLGGCSFPGKDSGEVNTTEEMKPAEISTDESTGSLTVTEADSEEVTEASTKEEPQKPPFSDSIKIETGDDSASAAFNALNTTVNINVNGSDAEETVRQIADLIEEMDCTFSSVRSDSELYKMNESGKWACSDSLLEAIQYGQELGKNTDGDFNIALLPLTKAWGFYNADYRVPEESEISDLLKLAKPEDAKVVELPAHEWPNIKDADDEDGTALYFGVEYSTEGMQLDLSYYQEGLAGLKIAEMINEKSSDEVSSAIVSIGGTIITVGAKPDGKPWKVAIQDPDKEDGAYIAVISMEGSSDAKCVSTEGTYKRFFEQDGRKYHYIIDPKTGYPADSDIVSSTVIASDPALADALDTALFIMGREKAIDFWRSGIYDFEMALLGNDGTFYVTDGISDSFKSDLKTEVIHLTD